MRDGGPDMMVMLRGSRREAPTSDKGDKEMKIEKGENRKQERVGETRIAEE